MKYIRYCFECGCIGPMPGTSGRCCPDHAHAMEIPEPLARQAKAGFDVQANTFRRYSLDKKVAAMFENPHTGGWVKYSDIIGGDGRSIGRHSKEK